MVTGYSLEDGEFWVRVPTKKKHFFSLQAVQTGSSVHPTLYLMGTGDSFPGVKRPGRETDDSPPASAQFKKMWIYTSTPQYAFMA
jgi:hypothetical protein